MKTQFPADMQTLLTEQSLSREQFAISKFLANLRFRHSFRGLEEDAVWRALERLVFLYEDALTAERIRRQLAERKLEALKSREEKAHG